jgi:hypothetical protein
MRRWLPVFIQRRPNPIALEMVKWKANVRPLMTSSGDDGPITEKPKSKLGRKSNVPIWQLSSLGEFQDG